MSRSAIVYYAHDVSGTRLREARRLVQEVAPERDLWVSGCCATADALDGLKALPRLRLAPCVKDDLRALPYPARLAGTQWATMRGSPDLALLHFFRAQPDYDHYWFVEYDVRYTGIWEDFFSAFDDSPADLLACHLSPYRASKTWVHWKTFAPASEPVPEEQRVMGFLVVCRLSRRLLQRIDALCQAGWTGHPEALWPTAAKSAGYPIEEIGGETIFTPPARRKKYYGWAHVPGVGRIGNVTAWPFYSDKSDFVHRTKDLLWHPVKD